MSPQVPRLDSVAQLAEVSRATASKALNGRPDVSPSTRDRVLAAAERLGYKQPAATQEGARLIGLVGDNLISPYTLDVIRGAATAALQAGVGIITQYTPTTPPTGTPMPLSREWFEHVRRQGWLGVITVTTHLTRQQIADIRELGIHLVAIDPANALPADIASIGATNWNGGVEATQHLIGLGHRRIGFVRGADGSVPGGERLQGYLSALTMGHLPHDQQLIAGHGFGHEDGLLAGRELLSLPADLRPTAIFAASDFLALGVYAAAREHGLRVPDDISVVGFDDTTMAPLATPALTTVRQPLEDMGSSAVRTVLDLEADRPATGPIRITTSLTIRESTAPPPA